MSTENNYAPFSNHEVQKAMSIIFGELRRVGKLISHTHLENSTHYLIEYDGIRYIFVLDKKERCTGITIL